MISPKDFVARWGSEEPLVRFHKSSVEGLAITDEEKEFLTKAGLPDSAAPYLSFEAPKSGELPTVADQWDQPKKFGRYRVIGSDGMGNPIAIDEKRAGEVACLDHDDKFARTLVNKTIRQLAESLLVYRDIVRDLVATDGDEAWADGELPPKFRKQLHRKLKKIDPAAMKVGCFWPDETNISDANADYPANVLSELRSPDGSVRLKASKQLESELRKGVTKQRKEQFGNKNATSPLIDTLDDPDPKVVHNAVVAIAQIGRNYLKDDRAYAKILPLVRSTHPLTSRWAIDAIITLRGEASLDDVLPLCSDTSQETREMALYHLALWLMGMRTQRSESIQSENQKQLRAAALHALGDAESAVRANAADLLREVGDASDIAALQECLEKESYWLTEQRISKVIKFLEGRS